MGLGNRQHRHVISRLDGRFDDVDSEKIRRLAEGYLFSPIGWALTKRN